MASASPRSCTARWRAWRQHARVCVLTTHSGTMRFCRNVLLSIARNERTHCRAASLASRDAPGSRTRPSAGDILALRCAPSPFEQSNTLVLPRQRLVLRATGALRRGHQPLDSRSPLPHRCVAGSERPALYGALEHLAAVRRDYGARGAPPVRPNEGSAGTRIASCGSERYAACAHCGDLDAGSSVPPRCRVTAAVCGSVGGARSQGFLSDGTLRPAHCGSCVRS